MAKKIIPYKDRVVIKLDPMEDEFGDSTIIRPHVAKSKSLWGTVVTVGKGGRRINDEWFSFDKGDRVCVPWRTGFDVVIDGHAHVITKADEIIAIEE